LKERTRLGVNIDHVATVRNARGGTHPDPVRAAEAALAGGADGIVAHLREDRRHIRDADAEALAERFGDRLNLEMAATSEMATIAKRLRPRAACLVPERRKELTTEGGLDVRRRYDELMPVIDTLRARGIRVSLFVEPDEKQINAASLTGAEAVELHTGAWCEAIAAGKERAADKLFNALREGARFAAEQGLEVHAGHGLDYRTAASAATLPGVVELNIGHFLVGEALYLGLEEAIRRMRAAIDGTAPEAAGEAADQGARATDEQAVAPGSALGAGI
jgi:pyridoxine 5-phosphate synthase